MVLAISELYFDSNTFATDLSVKSSIQSESVGFSGKIRCRLCGELISDRQYAINYSGKHIHQASNPAGHSFRFGIYQQAPGCLAVGSASFEHSWFNGFSWTIVICNSCNEHLGWLFSAQGRFYGLIIDKLLEEDSSLD
jgi:hypothetical protein